MIDEETIYPKIEELKKKEEQKNKYWLKSKTVILNIIASILTILSIVFYEFKELFNEHFSTLIGLNISEEYILIILLIVLISNIYLRFISNDKLKLKRKIKKDYKIK